MRTTAPHSPPSSFILPLFLLCISIRCPSWALTTLGSEGTEICPVLPCGLVFQQRKAWTTEQLKGVVTQRGSAVKGWVRSHVEDNLLMLLS